MFCQKSSKLFSAVSSAAAGRSLDEAFSSHGGVCRDSLDAHYPATGFALRVDETCGFDDALSMIVIVPSCAPCLVGENIAPIVHFARGGTLVTHVESSELGAANALGRNRPAP